MSHGDSEADKEKPGKWTVAFTLSNKNMKRMERAMAMLEVDQQGFLEYCIMRGIREAEKVSQPKSLWELTGKGPAKPSRSRKVEEPLDADAAKEIEWLERHIKAPPEDNTRGR